MVVPIRESANITHTSTAMANISDNLTPNSDINMVFDPENNIYNISEGFKEGRGCSLSFNIHKPRSPSISLSKCSKDYHVCVKRMSDRMDEDKPVSSIGSIKVKYVFQEGQMSRSLTVDFILFSLCIFILLYFSFSFSFFYF